MMQSYSVVLSGEAGQGLKTIESLFMSMLRESGYYGFLSTEVMSRVRGGNNTTQIRISAEKVEAPLNRIDVLLVLSKTGLTRLSDRLSAETIIIGEESHITAIATPCHLLAIPVAAKMKELGSPIYANNLFAGLLAGIFTCHTEGVQNRIRTQFADKGEQVIEKNLRAFAMGNELSKELHLSFPLQSNDACKELSLLSGSQAIGIGAIAGGLNFIASYPMSPSTAVLMYLARQAREYGIVVEQAEDELAAVNMALGAWYAGARAMVTTSGGGFALMSEGVSLSGAIETPLVVHLAQRPGPATGLPTRTEQGDLNLALYAGHGEFPRVIYAPGTLEDGITLTQRAFEVADEFQVPVFVLTDQYFLDGESFTERLDFNQLSVNHHFIKTSKEYQRYEITSDGISPRGLPGYGEGFVCVDSDEHGVEGRITEDFAVRKTMVEKRLRKLSAYQDIEIELIGAQDYTTLVVAWGSTYKIVAEAVGALQEKKVALAYLRQLYPLPKSTARVLQQAKRLILVENNASGQLGALISRDLLIGFETKILKYNGLQFTVEELLGQLEEALK